MPIVNGNKTSGVSSQSVFDKRGCQPTSSIAAFVQGISLGGPTSITGDDTYMRALQFGVTKSLAEGNPNAPSLQLTQAGLWKFRWVVKPGQRRISVRVKQARSYPGMRPSMTIKANANVGLSSDNVIAAPDGLDWVVMQFVFTATGTDVVFVELRNNLYVEGYPAYFDHIVVT
jgi:hypothetical protein